MSEAGSGRAARAAEVVRIEAAALEAVAQRLEGPAGGQFVAALDHLAVAVRAGRRVVLCGMGKSGLIARKVAATLVSMGVPAAFLHAAEALHGDLGLVMPGDVVVALSYSGETAELLRLLPIFASFRVPVVSLCGCPASTLARASTYVLNVQVEQEACVHQLVPTASTTAMLAMSDALAVELAAELGFAPQVFADLHPGGQLGRRLAPVRELMHSGVALPVVAPEAGLPEILHEISAKRLGMTTVQQAGRLLGVLSDGDLRRLMERDGPEAFHRTAGEVMHPGARVIAPELFCGEALELMEAHKITSLVVAEGDAVVGVVHMHDLLEAMGAGSGLV